MYQTQDLQAARPDRAQPKDYDNDFRVCFSKVKVLEFPSESDEIQ